MQHSLAISVIETDLEVEASFYAGVLSDAGLHAQVRNIEDPILTNVLRQIVLPRFEVLVPEIEAAQAKIILAEECRTTAEIVPPEEPAVTHTTNSTILFIGRGLFWLLLLLIPLLIFFVIFMAQH